MKGEWKKSTFLVHSLLIQFTKKFKTHNIKSYHLISNLRYHFSEYWKKFLKGVGQ